MTFIKSKIGEMKFNFVYNNNLYDFANAGNIFTYPSLFLMISTNK